jgi:hypothetical protein
VRFNYKPEKDEEYLWVIAEDVPDLLATKKRNSLSPMDVVAVLTEVVQTQQKKIEELQARLDAMRESFRSSLVFFPGEMQGFP